MNPENPAQRPAPGDVPVFNCHVYLSSPDEQGLITARVATLAGMVAQGRSEREALRNIVQRFKSLVAGHTARGEPIPWLDKPCAKGPGEAERFVPVHL